MKKFIRKLREWCGTADSDKKVINDKGEMKLYISIGAVVTIIFFCIMFITKCGDSLTCGLCSKCVNCVTCGACDMRESGN